MRAITTFHIIVVLLWAGAIVWYQQNQIHKLTQTVDKYAYALSDQPVTR